MFKAEGLLTLSFMSKQDYQNNKFDIPIDLVQMDEELAEDLYPSVCPSVCLHEAIQYLQILGSQSQVVGFVCHEPVQDLQAHSVRLNILLFPHSDPKNAPPKLPVIRQRK